MNYNKEGYSTNEVAQILHCCKATVMNYIRTGDLKASVSSPKIEPGHRRRIRILKEHIAEFMLANKSRFTKEELDTWGKYARKTDGLKEIEGVTRLEDLSGAWASIVKQDVSPEPVRTPDVEVNFIDSYAISIDGRISVGNVSAATASKIIDALLSDTQISYNEISIRKGTCYK